MRKTLTALSIVAALFAGQVMADEATVNSLQANGVQLSAAQNTAIANAEGQQLVNAIADLVAAQPEMAATIVAAAIQANASLTDAIVAAAIQAAPAQEQAIRAVVAANQKSRVISNGESIPTSSMPGIGGSGGGSSSLPSDGPVVGNPASPN